MKENKYFPISIDKITDRTTHVRTDFLFTIYISSMVPKFLQSTKYI